MAFCALASQLPAQTLSEALDAALRNYPRLHLLEAQRLADEAPLEVEKARRRPQLSLDLRGGEERFTNAANAQATGQTGNASLQGSQLLYDGGLSRNRISEARANLHSSAEALQDARQEVALELATAYVDNLKYGKLVTLAKQNVGLHRDVLSKIQRKYSAGAGPKGDVLLVKGRLALAQATLETRKRQLKEAQTALIRLTGGIPQQTAEPAFPHWAMPISLDEINFAQHPKVRAARSERSAALSRKQAAQSAFRPRLYFVIEGDAEESDRYKTLQEDAKALITLSYDLFDGGRRRAEVRQRISEMQAADWRAQDALLEIEARFANAWNELVSIEERIHLLNTQRNALETVVDAYYEQFELGKRPLINLLDVEKELFSARSSAQEERYNRLQAAYRVLAATGQLIPALR